MWDKTGRMSELGLVGGGREEAERHRDNDEGIMRMEEKK